MVDSNLSLLQQGGPMMWVLLVVSLFGFIIFIERTLFLHRGQIRTSQFLEGIRNLVKRGRRLEALTLCEDMPGPIPGIVKAILMQSGADEGKLRSAAEPRRKTAVREEPLVAGSFVPLVVGAVRECFRIHFSDCAVVEIPICESSTLLGAVERLAAANFDRESQP